MKTTIYYFSGTGNSLVIARDLSLELGRTRVISITKVINQNKVIPDADRVGLVYPVYVGGPPLIVNDFVEKLEITNKQYLFLVTNYGGMQGAAASRIKRVLRRRRIKLSAVFGITMPGNYTPLYEPPSLKKQKRIFEEEKNKVKEISKIIKEGTVGRHQMNCILGRWFLWEPLYAAFGSKMLGQDKRFWVTDDCDSCGICQRVCPVKNVKIINKKPAWQHNCQQCFACFHWCPKEAIQSGKKTIKRTRYRHPEIKLEDFIQENSAC